MKETIPIDFLTNDSYCLAKGWRQEAQEIVSEIFRIQMWLWYNNCSERLIQKLEKKSFQFFTIIQLILFLYCSSSLVQYLALALALLDNDYTFPSTLYAVLSFIYSYVCNTILVDDMLYVLYAENICRINTTLEWYIHTYIARNSISAKHRIYVNNCLVEALHSTVHQKYIEYLHVQHICIHSLSIKRVKILSMLCMCK